VLYGVGMLASSNSLPPSRLSTSDQQAPYKQPGGDDEAVVGFEGDDGTLVARHDSLARTRLHVPHLPTPRLAFSSTSTHTMRRFQPYTCPPPALLSALHLPTPRLFQTPPPPFVCERRHNSRLPRRRTQEHIGSRACCPRLARASGRPFLSPHVVPFKAWRKHGVTRVTRKHGVARVTLCLLSGLTHGRARALSLSHSPSNTHTSPQRIETDVAAHTWPARQPRLVARARKRTP